MPRESLSVSDKVCLVPKLASVRTFASILLRSICTSIEAIWESRPWLSLAQPDAISATSMITAKIARILVPLWPLKALRLFLDSAILAVNIQRQAVHLDRHSIHDRIYRSGRQRDKQVM